MFKIITIPFDRLKKGFDEEILNGFVINKHILSYRSEFFLDGEDAKTAYPSSNAKTAVTNLFWPYSASVANFDW
jgi:hypothetical protein